MNTEKNVPAAVGSTLPAETSSQEETHFYYTSSSYQKILDYHVSEILLTSIILGVIVLLRLHH